jgi:hypothetical protein
LLTVTPYFDTVVEVMRDVMLVTIRSQSGKQIDGLLLAMDETTMRLAVPRLNETIELRCIEESWLDERGSLVDIESIVFAESRPAVLKVGHA